MYETYLHQEVRSRICARAGIKNITPSDCKHIADEIQKTVQKNVSETTIKRFFGFAALSHGFSKYTLSALSEYANYPQLQGRKAAPLLGTPVSSWQSIHKKIGGITDYVLREIRNRSGLPYHMTISRKFAQHDLEEFYAHPSNFMCFIAHPGYGKTILLSHIVQKYFRDADAKFKDSIALFINAGSFYKTDQRKFDLDSHLKNILEIPQNSDLIAFINAANTQNKKFFLIIDGFAELVYNLDAKLQLFDDLIDFICALDNNPNIKVIMSMRSTLWVRFHDKIRHSAYLRKTWFKGNYFNDHDVSNVPPLTEDELREITENTGNNNFRGINPNLKAQLKFPFNIYLYYQLRTADPFLNYGSNIAFYELISRFIQEKIFKSNYYTEKLEFIKRLVVISNYGQDAVHVEKNHLIVELMTFKSAYMELVSDGILAEERRSVGFFPKEYVTFLHPQVFEYFIYMELFNRFTVSGEVSNIFEYIQANYRGNESRFILLQWALRHFIRTGDYTCVQSINKLKLNNYERNYLVLFFAENLKYDLHLNPDRKAQIKAAKVHEHIIEGLINLDYLDSCYSEGVEVLIEISERDQNWVKYQSILSIIDMLSMDAKNIQHRIEELMPYKDLCEQNVVNPLKFLQLIQAKIEGRPVLDVDIISMIEGSETKQASFVNGHPDAATGIHYMQVLGVNLFYGTPAKSIELINIIYKRHPRLLYKRTPFSTYMLLVYGIGCARERKLKKVIQIINIVTSLSKDNDGQGFTLYTESLLVILNAAVAKWQGEYDKAICYLESNLDIYKRNHLHANALIIFNMIIDTYHTSGDIAKMNEAKYQKRCFQEDNDISKDLFPQIH